MNQLKAGAALNYVVIILNILVGLIYTPYMLRVMGQSEYGLYSLVASIISYLTVLDLGLGNAVVRYTAKFRAEGKITEQYEMFGMFFVVYFILGIVGLILGLGLYFNVDVMFGDSMTQVEIERARVMMLILVINLAITLPMSIFGSIITAYERFVFPKLVNISRTILNTVVMVALLSVGYKAIAMVVIQTVFNILTLIINYIYCKKNLKIELIFGNYDLSLLKEIGLYSFWIFLNVIMDRVYWSTGQFVLGAVSGTVAVSVFAVAIQLEHMYMMFSTAISSVFLPKVTGMVVNNNDDKMVSDLFINTGRIQNIVMSLILSEFIVFGNDFIQLWAGNEYTSAYYITLAFFLALYIPLIQNMGITILQARNQMKFRSMCYIVIAVISVFLQLIFARIFGVYGCAIVISGSLFVGHGIVMNIYYAKYQRIDIFHFWKEILKMLIVPIVITVSGLYIQSFIEISTWTSFGLEIVAFTAIYLPLFWLFSMNNHERDIFISSFHKCFRIVNK